jgi:hypothetical protein
LNENQEQVTREKALIGAAGVHFVCGELSRRGFIALPTIRNTRGIDILAITPKGKLQCFVKPFLFQIIEILIYFFNFMKTHEKET